MVTIPWAWALLVLSGEHEVEAVAEVGVVTN